MCVPSVVGPAVTLVQRTISRTNLARGARLSYLRPCHFGARGRLWDWDAERIVP